MIQATYGNSSVFVFSMGPKPDRCEEQVKKLLELHGGNRFAFNVPRAGPAEPSDLFKELAEQLAEEAKVTLPFATLGKAARESAVSFLKFERALKDLEEEVRRQRAVERMPTIGSGFTFTTSFEAATSAASALSAYLKQDDEAEKAAALQRERERNRRAFPRPTVTAKRMGRGDPPAPKWATSRPPRQHHRRRRRR